ncbi:MAG: branched-chain amino acid ABC transporter permease [Candidatus Rokubacteria bacterium]|nr:branched-chain amino acid ABC transporter permease [Candidatus Rokubacteria bacterium]
MTRLAIFLLCLATAAVLPLLTTTYVTSLFLALFLTAALAQSYDLVGGHLGYMNLGHAAFFGIGAYTFGILYAGGWGLPRAWIAAVLLPVAAALVMSYPFFRLRGAYFALATFGLVVLLERLTSNLAWLTRGSEGLTIPPGYRLYPAYYVLLGLCAFLTVAIWWLSRSRIGLALVAIREDEDAIGAYGVAPFRFKCAALTASAGVAGLVGAVYTWQATYITPVDIFSIERAVGPVVMAMIGGSGTVLGPLVGSLLIEAIREALRLKTQYLALTVYGGMLILVGLFIPGGLMRLARGRFGRARATEGRK